MNPEKLVAAVLEGFGGSEVVTIARCLRGKVKRLKRRANRQMLAAKSIRDLVEWSGGLYNPPARFRNW